MGSDLTQADLAAVRDLVWDLDPLEDSQIELDFGLWQGSGQNIDMSVTFLPSILAGKALTDFVYVYAQFGELDPAAAFNYPSADGYEEYILRSGGEGFPPPIPEPATMFLLGTGLVDVAGASRRRKMRKNQA